MVPIRLLGAAAVALAVAAGPAQERSAYLEANVRMSSHLWDGRLALAEWCKSNGLLREAKSHYQFIVLNGGAGNPAVGKAKAKLKGDWTKKPSESSGEKWVQYREKLHEYFRELGDRAW